MRERPQVAEKIGDLGVGRLVEGGHARAPSVDDRGKLLGPVEDVPSGEAHALGSPMRILAVAGGALIAVQLESALAASRSERAVGECRESGGGLCGGDRLG